jgi:hypothetical protein
MPEETQATETGQQARDVCARALQDAGITLGAGDTKESAVLAGTIARIVRERDTEIARLKPLADDGTIARTDFINQALKAGARAVGAEHWKAEDWSKRLERWTLEDIIAQRDAWLVSGDKVFGAGRQTVDVPVGAPVAAGDAASAKRWTVDELAKLARA